MRVEFHPAAWREVESAQAWYEERSLLAASAFLREFSSAVQRIREAPSRYAVGEAGTRRILLDRFPFSIHYRGGSDVVPLWPSRTRNAGPVIGHPDDAV